ncbi:hypothetical protein EYZ11_009957 [Aspergillus tanneri]|uniref:Uncharacterized protein n=1 Tax=Aspergillus tanneri TaxID=1220188 RepID=A0A4S3J8P1_9EURO|nr:uncharacterized protein ATNIH1004_005469 [Aspergillus tanneri]KAA8646794.1 hypothetical protein ATNIH1004_005469 [Aspergillus tanneri]THC90578.1 hypothetical protein EYZ11_009957 [Aspergillus tanneri]
MATQVSGTAFITGGASGIGRGSAEILAQNGITNLALVDLNLEQLRRTREDLQTRFPQVVVETLVADVSIEASVDHAVRDTALLFGRIDIAVHSAGISGQTGLIHELSLSDWQKVIDINQTGLWLCQRAVIRQMMAQELRGPRLGKGVIVNVSSIFGIATPPAQFGIDPYTAAKHAVVAITKHDAKAYAPEGIRINTICPGFVDTPLIRADIEAGHFASHFEQTPMGRAASIEEIAESVLYLASPMSSYTCGMALVVDGGYTA